MTFIDRINQAASSNRQRIVLPEGEDARILDAAMFAAKNRLANVILLGKEDELATQLENRGCRDESIEIIDPASSPNLERYAGEYFKLRAHRGETVESSLQAMRTEPLVFAAMMVRLGEADGTIAGAVASSGYTIGTALRVIGRAPNVQTVSSFFVMASDDDESPLRGESLFADCALHIEPSAEELATIAVSTATSAAALLNVEPRVALLSFSTAGSGKHDRVDVVKEATRIAREQNPRIQFEGEIQFDAAIDASLRKVKAPESLLTDTPNVLVFPNLDAGNIGYKIAQRIGGMAAIGPVLQGLAKPANDLSRGCNTEDVQGMISLTAVQAQS